jgi:hypothetical protein
LCRCLCVSFHGYLLSLSLSFAHHCSGGIPCGRA